MFVNTDKNRSKGAQYGNEHIICHFEIILIILISRHEKNKRMPNDILNLLSMDMVLKWISVSSRNLIDCNSYHVMAKLT